VTGPQDNIEEENDMKLHRLWTLILALLLVSSCASVEVNTDFDPEYDFSSFKTYRWATDEELNPEDILVKTPLVRKRFVNSVERVMLEKGFTKVPSGDVDIVIVMHAGSKEKIQVDQTPSGPGPVYYRGGLYRGWYNPWWGAYGGYTDVSYYTEGTLVIDMVSWKTKELTWRGMGTKTVRDFKGSDKQQEVIDQIVGKILADFPPK
jgi:hypothetical protein